LILARNVFILTQISGFLRRTGAILARKGGILRRKTRRERVPGECQKFCVWEVG
jgi:hypothetical protein